jgi:general secretion pathway protein F
MRYDVKVMNAGGQVASLAIDAQDEGEAARQAREAGGQVITIRTDGKSRAASGRARGKFPLGLFSQELLALLDAGLPLVESIETLAEKEHRPAVKRILDDVIVRLREGSALSDALQRFPDVFPTLYIATVRASERTGDMAESLGRFVAYQAQLDYLRKRLVGAAIYPTVLIVVGLVVMLFLMGYVVPKFSHIYGDLGHSLPWMSQLLLQWGLMVEAHGGLILGALAALAALAGVGVTRPATRTWLWARLWEVNAVRERLRVYFLARFYRTLGMLLRGGTPLVRALDMAAGLLPPVLAPDLVQARAAIREGHPVSRAMEDNHLTTPVALRMLRVGERTGRMGDMMERIAGFYEEELARWSEWFVKLLEPVLMAVIGVVIGTVVMLMYMPIFELAGSIQ